MKNYDLKSISYIQSPQSRYANPRAAFFQTSQDEVLKLKANQVNNRSFLLPDVSKEQARVSAKREIDAYKAANVEMNRFWQKIFDQYSGDISRLDREELNQLNVQFKNGKANAGDLDHKLYKVFIDDDGRSVLTADEKAEYARLSNNVKGTRLAAHDALGRAFPEDRYVKYGPYGGDWGRQITPEIQRKIDAGDFVDAGGNKLSVFYFIVKDLDDAARQSRNDDDAKAGQNQQR
jgi:hypothetical protein